MPASESMNYKVISIFLLIIIIYLLRIYWFPKLQKLFASEVKIENKKLVNPIVHEDLKWDESKEIMPFIGALDYEISRKFYADIGFKVDTGEKHCRVKVNDELSFWLQNYSNKQWLNNSMIFIDVPDLKALRMKLKAINIEEKYKNVKVSEVQNYDWGVEFFMHDPSGVLWHFCEYKSAGKNDSNL